MAGSGNKPIVIEGLFCTDEPVLVWADGERDRWAARAAALDHGREQESWPLAVTSANRLSDLTPAQISWLIAKGPDGPARALIADPPMLRHRQRMDLGRVAVARFELDALPLALSEAGESADVLGLLMLPFRAPEAAGLVAGWLRHLGSARLWARLWLHRHAEAAARALIPAAVGRPGRARQNAGDALRYLTATGQGPLIQKTAEGYGHGALAVTGALLGLEASPNEQLTLLPPPSAAGGQLAVRPSTGTAAGEREAAGAGLRDADAGGRSATSSPAAGRDPGVGGRASTVPPRGWYGPQPGRKGKAPHWARPEGLPPVRRADGGVFSAEETAALVGALSGARLADPPEPAPGDPDRSRPVVVESSAARQPLVAGLDEEARRLVAAGERAGLAVFGRALLDAWLADGMPAAESWVLVAQAHLGDDATMEQLGPLVRSWPAKSRYARAIDGFAVFATVGSDVALRHLLAIEANMSGGSTNERAVDYLTQAAARRGLSVTQLADRLAITHGLDAGPAVDYGPRSFPVVVDEHLTAHVTGPDGRVLARPPKPGVKDTNAGAYQWFLQFKKDLRATAAAQTARLEREMHGRRLRPARDLAGVLLPHPILGPIARRLLWGEYDTANRLVRALRVAEDGSLADVHDTTVIVGGDTPLGIVHPADLGDELAGWAQIIADYEILQPFPQLDRPVVALTGEQRASTALAGFGPVSPDAIEALMRGRWHGNGYETGTSTHTQLRRALPGGLALLAELDPGVPTSTYLTPAGEQRITEIWVDDVWSDHWQRERRIPLGAADPAALSESLVELYAVR
ncbi:hypothetical protein Aph02nite_09930 [Actinoplanes philippinensis]|uniref:DUF4132 domain-containing protein n=1 Tax=Actinoplanes philippinensis TaxID=35752 RepID=A0A1I2A7K9_9ACTN|nr:DUF4132 domain-containing protein [Actinoplanes philippinensis]GIE75043.1 hypothetical protein Aph02nite_09930 [Actinoplanes philippinensis]SFE39757.1 protein of unknown function [Actinoplanes philippinensis]